MTVLLDGPVLAALVIAEHEHHDRVGRWLADQPDFAVCPITEAALLRFLLRLGESPSTALAVLDGIRQHPRCRFWSADLSHAELLADQLGAADDLSGAYLDALAAAHGGELATLETIVG
ncbi:MAG: PIN domain-containing protein [Propionibacteriales bacterium]|nr:PIN domain-containing protein [Propionibacteriales bacterium]